MSSSAQTQALKNYRRRLASADGRFEVMGLSADRMLIRTLARGWPRTTLTRAETFARIVPQHGGRTCQYRRHSVGAPPLPLVGADLNLSREETAGRTVNL